jgi:hypothetical protein
VDETARLSTLLDSRRGDLAALMQEWEAVAQMLETNV